MGIRRLLAHFRNRRSGDPGVPPAPGFVQILSMTASGPSLRVVVNQPVSLTAVPQIVTQSTAAGNPTQTPTAAAFLPNTVEQFDLSYPDAVDAAFDAIVPFQDGGVRSLYGAHIPAGSYTVV